MGNEMITVQGTDIKITTVNQEDYISLTDMVANFEGGSSLIEAWLRNKNTIDFLGVWERINNPDFNSPDFDGIKNDHQKLYLRLMAPFLIMANLPQLKTKQV